MTREEAKEKLYMEWQKFLEDNIDYAGISEAYKIAFKALEQEPCEDAISRQAVLDAVEDDNRNGMWSCFVSDDDAQKFKTVIKDLPSVKPQEPKTGKWITEEIGEGRKVYCSECKESAVFEYVHDGDIYSSYGHGVVKKTQYCPNCGTIMVEPQESEG